MRELYLRDYLEGNKRFLDECVMALKQISRGRYEVTDTICSVIINFSGERVKVFVTDDISPKTFRDLVYIIPNGETSTEFLYVKLFDPSGEKSLVQLLAEYKKSYFVLGKNHNVKTVFKLYSVNKPSDSQRDTYHAEWIDYAKQLRDGNEIYDEYAVNGIFSMVPEMLFECLNEVCFSRYGDRLLQLELIDDCFYLNDEKEVIGDRYRVVNEYDARSLANVQDLVKNYINECENKNAKIIEQLRAEKRIIERERTEEIDNQVFLTKLVSRWKVRSYIMMCVGVIVGIIISLLLK